MAICGQNLSIEFTLPFTDFLPDTVPFVFKVLGEQLDLSAFLPDTNTSHDILFTLDQSARLVGREGQLVWKRELQEGKWRRKCQYSSGWIDCWFVLLPNIINIVLILVSGRYPAWCSPSSSSTTPPPWTDLLPRQTSPPRTKNLLCWGHSGSFFLDFYGNAKFLKTFLCCIDCVGPCLADVNNYSFRHYGYKISEGAV